VTSPVELEVYDTVTGERLEAPCDLPGLRLEVEAADESLRPRDDGRGEDRRAGDCLFTAPATFDDAGTQELTVRLTTDTLDRTLRLEQEVVDLAWRLEPEPPEQARAGEATTLRTRLEPIAPAASAEPPEAVEARSDGSLLAQLEDDGAEPDEAAEDRVYSGTWTPAEPGEVDIDYEAVGGAATQHGQGTVQVVGVLDLGDVPPARFGTLAAGDRATALLDLSGARVEGSFELRLTSDFRNARSLLEIETGDGWTALGDDPVRVTLARGGRTSWPLRLRVGSCPGEVPDGAGHEIAIEAAGPDGDPVRAAAPLVVLIQPEPWLRCWWPLLALIGGALLVGVVIHGYWSPSRFPRRLGVVLSPEEDMTEGFFHGIRGQKGSGVGFYRDATIHVCEDFRLSGRKAGSLAALRADGSRVRIAPAPGATVWRRAADGEWEQLPADETPARFGIVYRNDAGSLFFELRNA
jgi:hypothetical protein